MRILSLYILRQLVAPFAFALTALTALMLLDQIAKIFRLLVGKGLEWQVIAEVFVLTIPFMLAVVVPMAVLVAVLYTFTRLASDNEITAMKASGISLFRIGLPVVGASVLVALGLFWFTDNVLPESNHELQSLRASINRKSPTFALQPRTVSEVIGDRLFLEAQRVDPETNHLGDVTIWDGTRPNLTRTIMADSGTMALNESQTDLYLTLYDGEVRETEVGAPDEFRHIWFETQYLRIPDIGNELDRSASSTRGDRELPIDSMRVKTADNRARAAEVKRTSAALALSYTDRLLGGLSTEVGPMEETAAAADSAARAERRDEFESRADAARRRAAVDTADATDAAGGTDTADAKDTATTDGAEGAAAPSVDSLVRAASRFDTAAAFTTGWRAGQRLTDPAALVSTFRSHAARRDRNAKAALRFEVEIWKKYSIPAACVIFVLIGVPLAVRYHDGGISMVVGVSFLVFTAYYVALIGGESVADQELLSPFWAMWAPNVLFLLVGVAAFFHSRRAGG
ncbi:MAG: LptF/LptG family permease [Gemmatimonadota bacterium]